MLTSFGKEVRRLRLQSAKFPKLKDLADFLGVSSAYLSSVETGRKPIPDAWLDAISRAFQLDARGRKRLLNAAGESKTMVQLSLSTVTPKQRQLATAFARRFQSLDEGEVEVLLQAIKE
jgi:hypothetical protein